LISNPSGEVVRTFNRWSGRGRASRMPRIASGPLRPSLRVLSVRRTRRATPPPGRQIWGVAYCCASHRFTARFTSQPTISQASQIQNRANVTLPAGWYLVRLHPLGCAILGDRVCRRGETWIGRIARRLQVAPSRRRVTMARPRWRSSWMRAARRVLAHRLRASRRCDNSPRNRAPAMASRRPRGAGSCRAVSRTTACLPSPEPASRCAASTAGSAGPRSCPQGAARPARQVSG
jgi:hypothetical protein